MSAMNDASISVSSFLPIDQKKQTTGFINRDRTDVYRTFHFFNRSYFAGMKKNRSISMKKSLVDG